MSGPKRGNPYISPYNNPGNYIFPETPLDENTQPESPLTKVTNDEGARDVYDNPSLNNGENRAFGTGQVQDKLALGSELDPSTFENPIAGGYYQTGPTFCDTCGKTVYGTELALPTHLGHQMRYGDEQVNEDIDLVHKQGGGYRIEAMYSEEPSNPSGMTGDNNGATTKPQLKAQPGDSETKSGYSWCQKPIEGDDYKQIIPDEAMRGDIMSHDLPNEDTMLLDEDDRTVPM